MLYVCRHNPSSKYRALCLACSIRSVCVIMLRQSESKCADGEAKLVEYVAAGEAKLVEYVAAADAKLDEYTSPLARRS